MDSTDVAKIVSNALGGDTISALEHPNYNAALWKVYRDTYNAGEEYIKEYLKQFSVSETSEDLANRKDNAYCPAHAKAAVQEILNAIHQRLVDVSRIGGDLDYVEQIAGLNGGVDRKGSTMNKFMGGVPLQELAITSKVGIYVDKENVPIMMGSKERNRVYLYTYKAEDIINWYYDTTNTLTRVLLRNYEYEYNVLGLPSKVVQTYRLFELVHDGVLVTYLNADGEKQGDRVILGLSVIPLHIMEINQSLFRDIETHQRALLQLASTDIAFITHANMPFYVEQRAMHDTNWSANLDADGDELTEDKHKLVGANRGRSYSEGMNAPEFINPAVDTLNASMAKQEQLKAEIRQLLRLNLTSVESKRATAGSLARDESSLESGLSVIGAELAAAEYAIAKIWHSYNESVFTGEIKYPRTYSLRSDDERLKEGEELYALSKKIQSPTLQKVVAKRLANLSVSQFVESSTLDKIDKEIDAAEVVFTDADIMLNDLEAGLVSPETASKLRGYADGEVEKAKVAHTERITRIALAQSSAAARGIRDMDADPKTNADESKKGIKE